MRTDLDENGKSYLAEIWLNRGVQFTLAKQRANLLGLEIPAESRPQNDLQRRVMIKLGNQQVPWESYGVEWVADSRAIIFVGAENKDRQDENWLPLVSIFQEIELMSQETATVLFNQYGGKELMMAMLNLHFCAGRANDHFVSCRVLLSHGSSVEATFWRPGLNQMELYYRNHGSDNLRVNFPQEVISPAALQSYTAGSVEKLSRWLTQPQFAATNWRDSQVFLKTLERVITL